MFKRYIYISAIILSSAISSIQAQGLLSKQKAMEIAMEQNFDIKLSDLNIDIAESNTSIFNSGYLPTLTGNAGLTYNIDNVTAQFQDGRETSLKGANSDSRNFGLAFNWVLFDGFNRKYNMERNQENLNLSQLNARATLENVLLNLFTSYYNVARNQQTVQSLKETLEISKDRLKRTEFGFDYGRSTKLDVSNAEVDVNTDSINYLNARLALGNSMRNLNLILAQEANTKFDVDTTLYFSQIKAKDSLQQVMVAENIQVLQAKAGIYVAELDTRINRNRYIPTVSLTSNYNNRFGNNNNASFLASSQSSGFSYGASLGWNIFDGGTTQTAIQNAQINTSIRQTTLEQTKQQLLVNFENAWSDYENRLLIVSAEEANLRTNELNFQRTEEQYRLGRIGSLDFRTAQSNLLTAETNLIQARYDAKLAELLIFQLTGRIQEAEF